MSNFWRLFLIAKSKVNDIVENRYFIYSLNIMKKYWSLIGVAILTLIIGWLWLEAFSAYWWNHISYYPSILNDRKNRWILIVALLCAIGPMLYLLITSKVKIKKVVIRFWSWAALFGLIHCCIKESVKWAGALITVFNTLLLLWLWIYLILGFAALWSRIERKVIKFKQMRWQEILLSFWAWICSFLIIIEILLWLWLLYWITSRLLFIWLWFMIRYEKKQLKDRWEILSWILEKLKIWINTWRIWYVVLWVLSLLSIAYLYYGIQNSFIPYSTAWDANHEYMYTPKILATNHGIYWWNTVWANMPWLWHQFITYIFSLTWATNWRFGLAPDTFAVSMNNISAWFVLFFGIAIIFQVFSLIDKKKSDIQEEDTEKWKKKVLVAEDLSHSHWITIGWSVLLLWLTSWMGAFLVIVDNKTDLWIMAFSLLALLSGLIFLQCKQDKLEKKELLKYVIIAWLMFWFATLGKITAFVDLTLFGLLLIALWFSPIVSLWMWVMVMGLVRKFNILTSATMITDNFASWCIILWVIVVIVWLVLYFSRQEKRKEFWTSFTQLLILWISFILPLLLLKLPRTIISQAKLWTFSLSNSIKSTFLAKGTNDVDTNKLLAQVVDEWTSPLEIYDNKIETKNFQQSFSQCKKAWNIYSESELTENLQDAIWDAASEDLWRYIWYGWQTFTRWWSWEHFYEKNWVYPLLKLLRPAKESCYWFNYDAKILCENANVINNFRIDDLRGIYENEIQDKEWEAWLLLKAAIDAYNSAKSNKKDVSDISIFHDEIVALRQYYQSHSIYSDANSVNIPYRYLVPLNISFNRSLQNLSSYYTDLWYMRVIIYLILIISLPYAIIKKNKLLTAVSLTTLIWWWIRWIIGSAILWYWTVLISWTMITLAIWLDQMYKQDKSESLHIILRFLSWVIAIIFGIQLFLNFMRIWSQWANSAFVWYKWNVWVEQVFDNTLSGKNQLVYKYGQQKVFNLQFPQYNPIIKALKNRKDEDGVIVAWTYIQYFLDNQRNVKGDGMLNSFWINSSDWDLCKTYRRLKNDNTHYLIIDPNIGTVSMWEWNEALFYRFFAKLNWNWTKIEIDGTITTLIRLANAWYLKLLSTNNLWVKYAFTLDDAIFRELFGSDLSDEELILARAKLAVLQYFDDADDLFGVVANIFANRVMSEPTEWIKDIANIYWMEINADKVAKSASSYLQRQWDSSELTQNEKFVLIYYLNSYSSIQQWDWSIVQNLLLNSVSGWSQVIALELAE